MLTGKELGNAIAEAIRLKGVTQIEVARHFGVRSPSVSDWKKRGTIDKGKLDALFSYFSDVVGPEHWGRKASDAQRWPSNHKSKKTEPHHDRKLVQKVCDLAETINDDGLKEIIGYIKCMATTHPVKKEAPAKPKKAA